MQYTTHINGTEVRVTDNREEFETKRLVINTAAKCLLRKMAEIDSEAMAQRLHWMK